MINKSLFSYKKKILKVSQLAAIAVHAQIGQKNETEADRLAVESMRSELNKISFAGKIVIGEGERDKAPMLYIGEKVGLGKGLKVDIALDPLEGTKLTANNKKNALTVISVGEKNTFLFAPDVYMEKIAIGPGLPKNSLDLDEPLENLIDKISFYKKKKISDIVICVLDRPRHKKIFSIIKKKQCKSFLIPDGDVAGAISTCRKDTNIDIYVGIGGAPEGVLAASAIKCLKGQMQCRLLFDDLKQKKRAKKMGIKNLDKKYSIKDLIKGNSVFVATGVTDGDMLTGVKKKGKTFFTNSLIITTKTKKINFITSEFKIK